MAAHEFLAIQMCGPHLLFCKGHNALLSVHHGPVKNKVDRVSKRKVFTNGEVEERFCICMRMLRVRGAHPSNPSLQVYAAFGLSKVTRT